MILTPAPALPDTPTFVNVVAFSSKAACEKQATEMRVKRPESTGWKFYCRKPNQ